MFDTWEYEVMCIDGEYAHLKKLDHFENELKLVARALLPPDIREGSRLKYELFEYSIID